MRKIIPVEERRETAQKKEPIDHVKALILERVYSLQASADDCAKAMGVSPSTWYARLRQPSDMWLLGEILSIADYLGIEIDEMRAAIRFRRNRRYEK